MPQPAGRLPPAPKPQALSKPGKPLNIHELFSVFNTMYFHNSLQGVFVVYSSKMTLCAGTCTYLGAAGGCRIALSEPLLTRRPPADTHDTLLHEMIHASLFLKHGVRIRDGPDGHGPLFIAEAKRINSESGSNITVYHSFHDEVDVHRVHWWTCRGSCGRIIKRAMNRAPAPLDSWWQQHERVCGGRFEKTHEPIPKEKAPRFGAVAVPADGSTVTDDIAMTKNVVRVRRIDDMMHRSSKRPTFSCSIPDGGSQARSPKTFPRKMPPRVHRVQPSAKVVQCPVCSAPVADEASLNDHLDACLADDFLDRSQEPICSRPAAPFAAPIAELIDPREEATGCGCGSLDGTGGKRPCPFVANAGATCCITPRVVHPDPNRYVPKNMRSIEASEHRSETANEPRVEGKSSVFLDKESGKTTGDLEAGESLTDGGCDVTTGPPDRGSGSRVNTRVVCDDPESFSMSRWCALLSTSEVIDFAIGNRQPHAAIDKLEFPTFVAPQTRRGVDALPKVPAVNVKSSIRDLLHQMSTNLALWHPNSDPGEPLFASSAARLGLTAKTFMDTVHMGCTQIGSSFKLSKDAELLFYNQDHSRPSSSVTANKHSSKKYESPIVRHVTNKRPIRDSPADPYKLNSEVAGIETALTRPASISSSPIGNIVKFVKRPRVEVQAADLSISNQNPKGQSSPGASDVVLSKGGANDVRGAIPCTELIADATCPMCGIDIERRLMHKHLEICLQDSDCLSAESNIPTVPTTSPEAMMNNGHSRLVDKETESAGSANCPICDKALSRKDLEAHTALCMDQSGLVDAFS
jgi:endogenous inhibitor of DNA gyrase (YacG/DUF329 family)